MDPPGLLFLLFPLFYNRVWLISVSLQTELCRNWQNGACTYGGTNSDTPGILQTAVDYSSLIYRLPPTKTTVIPYASTYICNIDYSVCYYVILFICYLTRAQICSVSYLSNVRVLRRVVAAVDGANRDLVLRIKCAIRNEPEWSKKHIS